MSDSLWPHELQHARPPCSSPTPGNYSNTHPSSRWCHPAISSSVVPFSSYPQSLPASGSFQMSQLFPWGGQSIGVSASTSVLPMSTQDWFPLGWTGWISLQSKGLSSLFQYHSSKASIILCSAARVQPRQDPGCTLRMNGVSKREREKTRDTSLDKAKSASEREREWPDGGCSRVWQSLAML